MIKATELRIGNWITWNGIHAKIAGISFLVDLDNKKDGYVVDLKNQIEKIIQTPWIDELEPIPLTPEILEKAGFVKLVYSDRYIGYAFNDFEVGQNKNGLHFDCSNREEEMNQFFVSLKFVHQLQNLYFALTGEELEINLLYDKSN